MIEKSRKLIKFNDLNEHLLVVGLARSGKTSTIVQPLLYQLINEIKMGNEVRVTVISPNKDVDNYLQKLSTSFNVPIKTVSVANTDTNLSKVHMEISQDKNDVSVLSIVKPQSKGDKALMMHIQDGILNKKSDTPHFLIVEELGRYINKDTELFLSLSKNFNCTCIFTTQAVSNLEIEADKISGKAMKKSILANTRNKIVFGHSQKEDVYEILKQMEQFNKEGEENILNLFNDLSRFQFVHQLMKDGKMQKAGIGIGQFAPEIQK